jgi:hypothetical protein
MFRDYGDLFLKFALSLPHNISPECRQVSQIGTRRSTNGGHTDESVCVCVCVRERERERERASGGGRAQTNN